MEDKKQTRVKIHNIFRNRKWKTKGLPGDGLIADDAEEFVEPILHEIPYQWERLNKFFHGQLTMHDISRFVDREITFDSFQGTYAWADQSVSIPAHCDMNLLWQWDEDAPIVTMYLPKPMPRRKISDLIPRGFMAKRVALIATTDEYVSVNTVYMLTGVISKDDPIHKEIRNEK